MPFPGNMVPAPVMAARQGMKDIAFSAVTDQGKPVAQYVNGALTGKGSGLLAPTQQVNAAPTQGNLTQAAQAAGKAMTLGRSTLSTGGGATVTSSPAGSVLSGAAFASGGMGAGGMGAAQAMMSPSGANFGSAAAMAGSAMSNPAASRAASLGSGAAAAAASSGGAGLASQPGITPGMRPAAPQFTPLPSIPSMPALSGVMAKLGGMLAGGGAGAGGGDALSGSGGSGATAPPASQIAGSAPADPTEAEFD